MILIESIKYYETDLDPIELMVKIPSNAAIDVMTEEGAEAVSCEVLTQLCRGRRFVRADGEEIVIGMSADVQDLLGMQIEVWESMEADMTELARTERHLFDIIGNIGQAGFWTRLKWLFTGVNNEN